MAATYKERKYNLKCMMKDKYLRNKMKNIGQSCTCPVCKSKFTKKTKAQAFCGSRYDTYCKDIYWNFMRYGTVPVNLIGYFKVLKPTKEEEEGQIKSLTGEDVFISDEDKKMIEALATESEELANEEKEEYRDIDDPSLPFNSWSLPEDDYVGEEDSYLI